MHTWKDSDPRVDLDGRHRAAIVILRPHPTGMFNWEAGTGNVELKHGWSVTTSYNEHPVVHEDDTWPEGWLWTLQPE